MRQLGELLQVPVQSPIIPLVVGDETAALAASAALLQMGFHVPAIRPPTVPKNTSRSGICAPRLPQTTQIWRSAHFWPC